jgi:hypothetical protein
MGRSSEDGSRIDSDPHLFVSVRATPQSSNTKISATKDNNQQTPINIQTRTSFDNTAISFKDIATIDGTDPYPAIAGRTPTGFSFARRQDATPRFSAREAW